MWLEEDQQSVLRTAYRVKRTLFSGESDYQHVEVVETSGPQDSAEEGCLSIPGVYEVVKRPRRVSVRALDLDGQEVQVEAEGIHGRILQHEIDHLDGVLFVDRIGPMRRALLRKQLRSFLD